MIRKKVDIFRSVIITFLGLLEKIYMLISDYVSPF